MANQALSTDFIFASEEQRTQVWEALKPEVSRLVTEIVRAEINRAFDTALRYVTTEEQSNA